jgi:hypothetical protein
VTLVNGSSLASNQAIIPQTLECYLEYNSTPYTVTNSAGLGTDYLGDSELNYPGLGVNPVTLLTSTQNWYEYSTSFGGSVLFGAGASLILVAAYDNSEQPVTISGGNSNLVVRVTYQIVTLPS